MKKAPTRKSQAGVAPPDAPADVREQGRLAGKRYSRIRVIGRGAAWLPVGTDGRLSDDQLRWLERRRAGESTDDYVDLLAAIKERAATAAEFLRQRGFPGTANVLFFREGDGWFDDAFEYDCEAYMATVKAGWPYGSVEMVDHYLIEYKGFDPDSPEALAARVLVATQGFEWRGPLSKDAVVAAYQLGELAALDRVYSIDRQRAQKPKPRRQAERWREFARSLIRHDPSRSAEHYWRSLGDGCTREHGDADVYRDDEKLIWAEGEKQIAAIRFRSFRRHVEAAQAEVPTARTHKPSRDLAT